MAKNIIVCSDGTGNTAIKGRGTNVFKLFEAVDLSGHRFNPSLPPQVAIYDDGVGTQNLKLVRIASGACGFGLARNVKQLYMEIVRLYDPPEPETRGEPAKPGDALYLFGFSRGAFTVRTLVGLIATCGLLDRKKLDAQGRTTADDLKQTVAEAYEAYRKCYRTRLAQIFGRKPDRSAGADFKQKYSHDHVRIAFLGVWDTVDAVGLPFYLSDLTNATVYRFKFPDARLSPSVERACHALAIDDERQSFHPRVWDEHDEDLAKRRISQVWFAGAHSNVGGGYPKQGMSLVALDWMLSQAEHVGLRITPSDREFYQEHANFDDKLYDPRSGFGIYYRWKIRDIARICARHGVKPKIHLSVLERIAHGIEGYAPGNLPEQALVVYTTPYAPDPADAKRAAATLSRRVAKVQAVYSAAGVNRLGRVRLARWAGMASYYLLLAATLAVVAVASGATAASSVAEGLRAVGQLVMGLFTSPAQTALHIGGVVLAQPLLLVAVVVAYLIDLLADRRISAEFSRFWHMQQPELRVALKGARQEAQKVQAP